MVFGMIRAVIDSMKAPSYDDAYFGHMKFVRDHWVGNAATLNQERIEVILQGGSYERRDFSRQQTMYEEVMRRYPSVVNQALPLIAQLVEENGWGPPEQSRFAAECQLAHVALPDPDAADRRWDLTVVGAWPGFQQRSGDRDPEDNMAMFVIEMDGWQAMAVDLA